MSTGAESPTLDDHAFARRDRLRRAVVGAPKHRPQRQPNPVTAVCAAVAERTERRLHSAVILSWDDILEFDVPTGPRPPRFPERDQPVEVAVEGTERLPPP